MGIIEAREGKPIDFDELERIADEEIVLAVNESDITPILLIHNTNKPYSQVILELTKKGYAGEPPKIGASEAVALLKPKDFTGIKLPSYLDLCGKIEFDQWRDLGLEHTQAVLGSIGGQRAFKYNTKAIVFGKESITEYLANAKEYEIYARLFERYS